MKQPPRPPEPSPEYLEANDLQYLKADELYFSSLRNRFGLFESKIFVFKADERIAELRPVLDLVFKRRGPDETVGKESPEFSALDIGCGEGDLLLTLAQHYRVGLCEGIDISATKLKIAVENFKSLKVSAAVQQEDRLLAREIKSFLTTCPKNLLFEQDLRLFHRFFETVSEANQASKANGSRPADCDLSGVTINFKMQNVFSYDGKSRFQTVFLLRMTKWVFLTMGKKSLKMLLLKALRWVAENGLLVISKVGKASFKQTARVVHKKENTTYLFGRHQAALGEFMEMNGLEELGFIDEYPALKKAYWVLTRKENTFWNEAHEEAKGRLPRDY